MVLQEVNIIAAANVVINRITFIEIFDTPI